MALEGKDRLLAALRKHQNDRPVSVVVGYEDAVALYLHEMDPVTLGQDVPRRSGLGHLWGPSDYGPQFLTGPLRSLLNDGTLRGIVNEALESGRTLKQALLLAGLRLQRESQELIPAEHGDVKRSAFTEAE
jgi:hypothetical protein